MSNREAVMDIINQIPEYNLAYVANILRSIKNLLIVEEEEPDEWDLEMISRAEKENDDTYVTLEELAKDLNLDV